MRKDRGNMSHHRILSAVGAVLCLIAFCADCFGYFAGTGTSTDPYQISTVNDWKQLMTNSSHWSQSFVLINDLDLAGVTLSPIGKDTSNYFPEFQGISFTGVFDGRGYIISNASVYSSYDDFVGLFGLVNNGGTIKNVRLENIRVQGREYVGGLAGLVDRGSISSCSCSGQIDGDECIGGMVGYNAGRISDCSSAGTVSGDSFVGGLGGTNGERQGVGSIYSSHSTSQVNGKSEVGGLIGMNDWGSIGYCSATGSVTGRDDSSDLGGVCGYNSRGNIFSCFSLSIVTGGKKSRYIGGVCGEMLGYSSSEKGTLSYCYFEGKISGGDESEYLGGVCGSNGNYRNRGGAILQCYSNSDIVSGDRSCYLGGLCGSNRSTIRSCYSMGTVTGGNDSRYLGGFCGDTIGTIDCCYATAAVQGGDPIGGFAARNAFGQVLFSFWDTETSGQSSSSGGIGLSTERMKTVSVYANAGWSTMGWVMDDGVDYPRLYWEGTDAPGISDPNLIPLAGSGAPDDPYLIYTAEEFASLYRQEDILDKHIRLMSDLDMTGIKIYPIGNIYTPYSGVFDGNRHVIGNAVVYFPSSDSVGLFGQISASGQVFNLGIQNCTIIGQQNVGGVCGDNWGAIVACWAHGGISGGDGSYNLGGLCGINSGTIQHCYTQGKVSGGQDSSNLGGLCGTNGGTITGCYAAVQVTVRDVRSGSGFCGWNDGGIGGDCFWDTELSGLTSSEGGTGKTTAEMKSLSTFTTAGWDMTDTWWLPQRDYPRLRWEVGQGSLRVTILPSEAVIDGAKWRRVGTYDWLDSGQTEASVPAVKWDVEFKPTQRLRGPYALEVSVFSDELSQVEVIYTEYYSGAGTEDDPYQIKTVADWKWIIAYPPDWDKHFILVNDIDFAGEFLTPIAPNPNRDYLKPYEGTYFTGTLDGNSHVLRNVVIDLPEQDFVGLFGGLGPGSVIHHLGIVNCSITGNRFVGCLFGVNGYWENDVLGGTINDCYITGSVRGNEILGGLCGSQDNGTIRNCSATVEINGWGTLGGICGGNNFGSIINCQVSISANGSYNIGGLCGSHGLGTIQDSSAEVSIVGGDGYWKFGGLCGETNGTISGCYAMGSITCGNAISGLGGLCGMNNYCAISNSFACVDVAGGNNSQWVGGLCGGNYGGEILGCFASGSVSGKTNSNYLGGLVGMDMYSIARGCYATGDITGGDSSTSVGGLCGGGAGTISNCYSTGNVSAGENSKDIAGLYGWIEAYGIGNCFSTGRVTAGSGSENVGGFCGRIGDYANISYCFWNIETSGQTASAGGEGKTTGEMKTIAIFTSAGWDFVGEAANGTQDVWRMCGDGFDYPKLSWEYSRGGDMDCPDGVGFDDLLYLAGRWMASTPEAVGAADANGDGKADLQDFGMIAENWMK